MRAKLLRKVENIARNTKLLCHTAVALWKTATGVLECWRRHELAAASSGHCKVLFGGVSATLSTVKHRLVSRQERRMPLSTLRRVGVPVALGDVDRPEVDGLRPDVPAHAAGTSAGWLRRWATAVRWLTRLPHRCSHTQWCLLRRSIDGRPQPNPQ